MKNPQLHITKLTYIITFLFIAFGCYSLSAQNKSKAVIVKNAFFNESNILKQNAALLITDEAEINIDERLFFNNASYGHACGYHYDIQFWVDADSLIADIPFNQECEVFKKNHAKIQSKMKYYIGLLEKKPTHYIYHLRLSAKTEPETVLKVFENSNLDLFFMRGSSSRYTSVAFTYLQEAPIVEQVDRSKWEIEVNEINAITKMEAIIDSIKAISMVVEQSEISFPMQSFEGGFIKHKGHVTLKFINGTDLTQINAIIRRNNGITGGGSTPEYYFIELLDASDDIEVVKQKVKDYDIVTGVFE